MTPLTLADVEAARERIRPHLQKTPFRSYPPLDDYVGNGIRVFVKHENHQPTSAFKVRNGLSAVAALPEAERRRGLIAASTGNHGQGVAWAGERLGAPVTICVPLGNNPEKNRAMRGYGARLVEEGADYDEAVQVARRLAEGEGLTTIHSTNNKDVIAGAGTITLEMAEEEPDLEALVVSVGGGSQAVGAITVMRALRPGVGVYGVQASMARACHDSWHAGKPLEGYRSQTMADGLATRSTYAFTFPALLEGLAGFVAVDEVELAEGVRRLLCLTHNLAEPAGAAGLAGVLKLRETLRGKRVGIILSGGNADMRTLSEIIQGRL